MELLSTWVRASARNTPGFRRRQDRQSRTGRSACPPKREESHGGAAVFLWQLSAEKEECKGAKPLGRYILTALLRQMPVPLSAPLLRDDAQVFLGDHQGAFRHSQLSGPAQHGLGGHGPREHPLQLLLHLGGLGLEPPAAAEHIVHRQAADSLPLEARAPVQQKAMDFPSGCKAVLILDDHTYRRVLFQKPHNQHASGGGPEVDGPQAPVTGLQPLGLVHVSDEDHGAARCTPP